MFRLVLAVWLTLAGDLISPVASSNYSIESFYPYVADCSGASNVLKVRRNDTCAKNTCSTDASNNAVRAVCDPDFLKRMKQIFGSTEHIIQVMFDDSDCSSFSYAVGYRVDDECLPGYFESESLNQNFSYNATLFDNGSAQIDYFTRGDVLRGTPPTCSSKWRNFELARDEATTKTIQDTACVAVDVNSAMYSGANYCQWYTSYTFDSGLSTGAIVGLACGCVVVAVLIVGAGLILYRRWTSTQGRQATDSRVLTDVEEEP